MAIPLHTWLTGMPAAAGAAGTTAVVVDVLRATTTIATALAHDARYVATRAEVLESFELRAALEARGEAPLLGGERGGTRVPGFDLGNSPREYTPARVAGRAVILCTTNGTAAVARCADARALYAGAFVNVAATAAAVAKSGAPVTLCCAGREGAASLEDAACAGLLAELLCAAQPYEPDDATTMARLCWRNYKNSVVGLLQQCRHGRYLASLGFDDDLFYAGQIDAVPTVAARGPDGHFIRGT